MVDYKTDDSDDDCDAGLPPPPTTIFNSMSGGAGGGVEGDAVGEAVSSVEALGLSTAFLRARGLYASINSSSLASNDPSLQGDLDRALRLLTRAQSLVRTEHIFSSNEKADDVNTEDLALVLIEFYLGALEQRRQVPRALDRLVLLRNSQGHYAAFLDRCETLGLLKEGGTCADELVEWRQRDAGALDTKGDAVRQRKIGRFQREREAQARLAAIEQMVSAAAAAKEGMSAAVEAAGCDEEILRERTILHIESSIRQALDDIGSMAQEMEILQHMARMAGGGGPPRVGSGSGSGSASSSASADDDMRTRRGAEKSAEQVAGGIEVTHISAASSLGAGNAGNGSLQMTREVIRGKVLQPGHRLPTQSLEEYADRERAEAIAREERERDAPKPNRRIKQLERDGDEDDAKLAEEATYRDRAWDNWKDEHEKGAGNKANKII